jgi:hypothetical protein
MKGGSKMFSLKKAALLAATGACLVAPAIASADSGPKATGSGSSPGNAAWQINHVAMPFSFSFDAQNPSAPTGTFTFQRADGTMLGTVTCYTQVGNQAAFSGQITRTTGFYNQFAGSYAYFGVQDNGQGAQATALDGIQQDIGPQYQGSCGIFNPALTNGVYPYAVTSGNIQVH